MQWPWVSRERYDDMIACYERALDRIAPSHPEILTQADPPPQPPDPARREPSLIAQVIREQSGGDPRLAAHLRTYAGKLKRDGNSDEEIAFALGQWVSTEPDIPVS